MDNRNYMGKNKDGVIFPVSPNLSEMSDAYLKFIEEVKSEIQKKRISVVLNANSSMICLYWDIGRGILKKQEEEGWGAKIIDRIAKDLKDAFPEMSGFSPRNIKYMRKFAESWPDFEIVQRVVAQIPWRTNISLMDKLRDEESRIWYAYKVIVGAGEAGSVTIPRGQLKNLKASFTLTEPQLTAPLKKGQVVGTIDFQLNGKSIEQRPLIVMEAVEEGGFFGRMWDFVLMKFHQWFGGWFS